MIGIGRGVSIIAPTLVGFLLASGWTPEGTYLAFAIVLVLAGLATLALDWTYRGCSEDPETPEAPKETKPTTTTQA